MSARAACESPAARVRLVRRYEAESFRDFWTAEAAQSTGTARPFGPPDKDGDA